MSRRKPSRKSASAPPSPAARAGASPVEVVDIPYGESLWPCIAATDPSRCPSLLLALGVLALALAPLMQVFAESALGIPAGWDEAHGVRWADPLGATVALLEESVGVGPSEASVLAWATVAAFGLLFVVDFGGRAMAGGSPPLVDWPRSWDTGNTQCYTNMFCEPTRPRSLVRRPGNVYSNALYLFGGLVVLAGCFTGSHAYHRFFVADAMFGAMLVVLAALSVVWHASNAPTSQYIDLWSMNCCIAYLLVRFVALAACRCLVLGGLVDNAAAAAAYAAWGCVGLYTGVVCLNGKQHWDMFRRRELHGACPFSGRRLLHTNPDFGARGVLAFACLPVAYLLVPWCVQYGALGCMGSVVAGTGSSLCLVLGWSVRMSERFCLDGNIFMNAVHAVQAASAKPRWRESGNLAHLVAALLPSWLAEPTLTAVAAFASPTASLHFFTSITLLLGYCQVRTIDALAL